MISFKRELFYFVIDSYIKSLYFSNYFLKKLLRILVFAFFPIFRIALSLICLTLSRFRFISSAISARVVWAMPIP